MSIVHGNDVMTAWGGHVPPEPPSIEAKARKSTSTPVTRHELRFRVVIGASEKPTSAVQATTDSGWLPEDDPSRVEGMRQSQQAGPETQAMLAEHWVSRATQDLSWIVGEPAPALYVGLHGLWPGGEDLVAFFSQVRVSWERLSARSEDRT